MQTVTGLKILLNSHGMNQSQLAEQMGVSNSMVSQWATGKVKMSKTTQDQILNVVKGRNKPAIEKVENTHTTPSTEFIINKESDSNKKIKTLEGRIKECKRYCSEAFGFEVVIVKSLERQ